jgi:hypothetical protein
MKMKSVDWVTMYGDPDEDYNSFEKCVVRTIDATDSLATFLQDFLDDINFGQMEGGDEFVKTLRTQKAVCISLRDALREWTLTVPYSVSK